MPVGSVTPSRSTFPIGPECFTIPGQADAFPYVLQAHYYSRGPMGYGMGKLEAIEHDGKGHLSFMEHPFVIMKDRAYVDLGRVEVSDVFAHDAYLRLYVQATASAAAYLPFPADLADGVHPAQAWSDRLTAAIVRPLQPQP
jgi:hypothetical protein